MRLDPLGESFRLRVEECDDALQLISRFAARRGKILEDSQSEVVFQVGSSVQFLLLGTFYERGRRSLPVKVTVSVPSDRTSPWLHVEMESQERG